MKYIFSSLIAALTIFLMVSCQKEDKDDLFTIKEGILKSKTVFASSAAKDPYSRTDYYYDDEWHLVREVTAVRPDPVTFKTTYTYRDGRLTEKDRYGIPQGSSSEGITEASLEILDKHLYEYPDDQTMIERNYDMLQHQLRDSVVYEYAGSLLIKESHFTADGTFHWGKEYRYDGEGHLTRLTLLPENTYTVYTYRNGRKISEEIYDSHHKRTVKKSYDVFRTAGMDIIEEHYKGPYGKGLISISYYKDGLLHKIIRYDLQFNGAESAVEIYTYY